MNLTFLEGFCVFLIKSKKNDKIALGQHKYSYLKRLERQKIVLKSSVSDDLKCQKWLYIIKMHDFNVFEGFCAFMIKIM